MPHFFIDILFLIVIFTLILIVKIKQNKCQRNADSLIDILSKNINFLDNYYKIHEIQYLKKTISLYAKLQVLLKISKCDYVSFFKYNYSKNFIMLNLILSTDNIGNIVEESEINNIPLSSNEFLLKILNCYGPDLCSIVLEDVSENIFIHELLIKHKVNKIYFKNIFKDTVPDGFILMCFKEKDSFILEDDKIEILRIINKIKYLV